MLGRAFDDEEEDPGAPIIDDAPEEPAAAAPPDEEPIAPPEPAGTTVDDADLAAALGHPEPGAGGPPDLAPLPDLTPTTAAAPPAVAPPPGARQKFTRTLQSPEDAAIAADQAKTTEAAVTAERNKSAVEQARVKDEQKFRAEQTAQAIEHQKRLDELLKEHDAKINDALQRQQQFFDDARAQTYEKVMGPDLGNRILGALAVSLGGLGGGPNQALQIYDNRMKQDYAERQAKIEGAWKVYEAQSKNVAAARAGLDRDLEDLNLTQAARHEAAADQLEQMKIAQGIPAEQARSDAAVVALRQKALDIRRDEAKKAQDKIEWDTYGKAKGGGGGGAGAGDAMGKFIEAAGNLKPGDPIPPEFGRLAAAAHIKPNQIASEVDKYRGSGAKSAKGLVGQDKEINDRMNKYENQAVGTARTLGPVRVLSQIEAMRQSMDEAVKSGDSDRIKAAMVKAKEQAGTIMSGGKMTNAQIKIMHDLESTADEITAKIGKFTGNPTEGAGAVRRLTDLIHNAGDETLKQISDIRQRGMEEMVGPGGAAATDEKKATFMRRNAGLYSEVKWMGKHAFDEGRNAAARGAGGSERPAVAVPSDHGEAFEKLQRAKAAAKNPNLSPAQQRKAQDYIDAYQRQVSALGER